MIIKDALALINHEHDSDEGLDLLFRMSADIQPERLEHFIAALKVIETHYTGKVMIEKDLVYKLVGFYRTLSSSARHWTASRPEGLTRKAVHDVNMAILNIFSTD